MNQCFDEGRLRAYADGELSEFERAAMGLHLTACAACRRALAATTAAADQTRLLLAPATPPNQHAALAQFRAAHPVLLPQEELLVNQTPKQSRGLRRAWIAPIAVIAVLAALLALPPVRAAADSLLQIFRVQQVVFVPVNTDRIRQLDNLNFDSKTLFLAEPKMEGDAKPQTVASAQAASAAVGFAVGQPSELPAPANSTSYAVSGKQTGTFQVNVAQARELLRLLDVKDVTLPDALGSAPITVKTEPFAVTTYTGQNYSLSLMQGLSPEVSLPDGVDLSQLGKAMLQILGTAPDQADAMAKSIDWSSTLVVPIPSDIRNVQKVTVNGVDGMLVGTGGKDLPKGEARGMMLYWKSGDQFYVLQATGNISTTEMVLVAESVK